MEEQCFSVNYHRIKVSPFCTSNSQVCLLDSGLFSGSELTNCLLVKSPEANGQWTIPSGCIPDVDMATKTPHKYRGCRPLKSTRRHGPF